MKKIILTIFCLGMLFPLLGSAARPYGVEEIPNVQVGNRYRFTSNPDGVLSPSAVAEIDSLCYSLRHRALAQVAVVAVEDIRGDDLFSFAHTLFFQWGVGRADSDNGLGILLVVDRREVRFVTGPGLEGVLPDALCKRIQMRYMLPYFREGDYSAGMVAGLRAVASVLEGSELDSGGNDDFRATDDLPAWAVFLIVFLVVFVPRSDAVVNFMDPFCGIWSWGSRITISGVLSVGSRLSGSLNRMWCAGSGGRVLRLLGFTLPSRR